MIGPDEVALCALTIMSGWSGTSGFRTIGRCSPSKLGSIHEYSTSALTWSLFSSRSRTSDCGDGGDFGADADGGGRSYGCRWYAECVGGYRDVAQWVVNSRDELLRKFGA